MLPPKIQANLEILNIAMINKYELYRDNPISARMKSRTFNQLRLDIYGILKKHCQGHGLELTRIVPFGSVASNISTMGSDLDIIVCFEKIDGKKIEVTINRILRHLMENLEILEGYKDLQHIDTALVPIIKGFKNNIGLDISIHVGSSLPTGFIASRFIHTVTKFYPDFAVLMIFIKGIFKRYHNSQNNNKSDLPNSYALALMITHFLQIHNFLPNLHEKYPERFHPKEATWKYDMVCKKEIWDYQRKETPARVFFEFLRYYSRHPIENCAIHMESGKLSEKHSPGLQIFDPLDNKNPGRTVKNTDVFQRFVDETLEKIKDSKANEVVNSIWPKSEFM